MTGGGSGIGLETALTFADLGADVAVLDWTPGAAAATAERIEGFGRKALAIEGDAGDEKTVVEAFESTRQQARPGRCGRRLRRRYSAKADRCSPPLSTTSSR